MGDKLAEAFALWVIRGVRDDDENAYEALSAAALWKALRSGPIEVTREDLIEFYSNNKMSSIDVRWSKEQSRFRLTHTERVPVEGAKTH